MICVISLRAPCRIERECEVSRVAQVFQQGIQLLVMLLGIGMALALPRACRAEEAWPQPPTPDLEEFARVFGTTVLRSQNADGGGVAEVRTVVGIIRQEKRGGKVVTTETPPRIDLDALASQPGATIARSRKGKGIEITEFRRGGVVIRQMRENGRLLLPEVVDAGGEAVLCLRQLLVSELTAMNACYPRSHPDMRAELKAGLDKVTAFIANNALVPITLKQSQFITNRLLREPAEVLAQAPSGLAESFCQSGEGGRITQDVLQQTPMQVREHINRAVRVPRPPLSCTGF